MIPGIVSSFRRAGGGTGDPYWDQVVSLLHFDAANNTTVFADEKGYNWTPVGDAKISTAQSMFGGSSLYLDGSGDFLKVNNGGKFDFGAGDFTLEAWVRPNSNNSNVIISNWYGQNAAFCAFIMYLTDGKLQLSYGVGGFNGGTPSTNSVPNGVWSHVAVCRTGNVLTYYINGVQDPTKPSISGALNVAPGEAVAIGCLSPNTGPGLYFNGYIDECRATEGRARYSGNFTPPAGPFPNHA